MRVRCGLLGNLARSRRGNVSAIVAMTVLPLAGMVGGGLDLSRMYIVKTRLQHACDAGVLAGRKQMGGGTWAYNNYEARSEAERYFDANIQSAPYGATSVTKTFSEEAGKVSGTASAVLPMTIMRVFGRTTETLSVACDAEMRLPNTDIMFVLDTTGSMAQKAVITDKDTKIEALRASVKCFYEIVARIDTKENCVTGTPSGGTGDQVQIRFGFMPYATNVNVGRLLPTDWFANSWSYQTRLPQWTTSQGWVQNGNPTVTNEQVVLNNVPQNMCNNATADAYGYNSTSDSYSDSGRKKTTTQYETNVTGWSSANNGTCSATRTRTVTIYEMTGNGKQVFDRWHYAFLPQDVSGLKNGTAWEKSVELPIGKDGKMRKIDWDGCIEERQTVWQSSYSPIPSGAKDLDIDMTPATGDPTTQWGPALPDAIFARAMISDWSQLNRAEALTTADYYNRVPYDCPAEARKMQSWPTAKGLEDYVDKLKPGGNTYHDIGLLWGARFVSPTGIFRAENEFTPKGAEIERHLIFMTDGEACTSEYNYGPYGFPWLDRRTTDPNEVPTSGCQTAGTLTEQVNVRTDALCSAVKNKNITLWVIWFGPTNTVREKMLRDCATSGRFFAARDAAGLQNTFKSIADQISALRLTK